MHVKESSQPNSLSYWVELIFGHGIRALMTKQLQV